MIGLLTLGFSQNAFTQKQDSTAVKPKVYSGKTGFTKRKAVFLKVKSDSAFVYVFNGQAHFALTKLLDTLILLPEQAFFETNKCALSLVKNNYEVLLKFMDKKVKLKRAEKAELFSYQNEAWINEQREIFAKEANDNPLSYTLYDRTIEKSNLLSLLAKDPILFLKEYKEAFKEVKFVEEEME